MRPSQHYACLAHVKLLALDKPDRVVPVCNLNTWEVKAGGLEVQSHPQLRDSLDYRRQFPTTTILKDSEVGRMTEPSIQEVGDVGRRLGQGSFEHDCKDGWEAIRTSPCIPGRHQPSTCHKTPRHEAAFLTQEQTTIVFISLEKWEVSLLHCKCPGSDKG